MVWSSIVSGLGALGGGLMSGLGSLASGIFNSYEAEKTRNWQERMSNTAHQREVKDLRKAGLNPILTATGGQGASSPVGGQAVMQPMDFSSGYQANTQRKIANSQTSNIDADTHVKQMQWSFVHEQEQNEYERRANIIADREFTTANTLKTMQDIENSKVLTNAQALNLISGAKFNNRRASGFSQSKSSSKAYGAGAFGIKGNYNTADSYTKSW